MTKRERNNWIVNIENTAAAIEPQLGSAVVESVFKRYGAHGTWDLIGMTVFFRQRRVLSAARLL